VIVVVEDNEADVDLLRYALGASEVKAQIRVLTDGEEAFRFLDEVESGKVEPPALFVLDLNLPRVPGWQVLERIRRSPVCRDIAVVVLSSSSADADRQDAVRLGASRYITKPSDLDEYLTVGKQIAPFLSGY
jgi:CheY-like chemotaxis protein